MKKKTVTFLLCILAATMLAGCGFIPELPQMTEQQEKLVTEYAAGLILKHDDSFKRTLLSEEELALAEAKEEEARLKAEREKQLAEEYVAKSEAAKKAKEEKKQADKNKDKADKEEAKEQGPATVAAGSVAEFIGLDGIGLDYQGYDVVSSYPQGSGDVFSVDAQNGKELVVVKFNMSNVSSSEVGVDILSSATKFSLTMPDGSSIPSCSTLLLDDLSIYRNKLASGAGEEVVLLFEINEGTSVAGASVSISSSGNIGKLDL